MLTVSFHDTVPDTALKFAVIAARYRGKWVYCRHRDRNTYEIPGGHREPEESILQTAERELREETAAETFRLVPLCAYSVSGKNSVNQTGDETFGMLFLAEISRFSGSLEFEIESISFFSELPDALTYPEIQPKLWERVQQMLPITVPDAHRFPTVGATKFFK